MDSRIDSLGGLLSGLAGDVQDLIKGEISLARAEFDQKLQRVILAAVWLLGGALVAFAGLVVLLEGAAAVLAHVVPAIPAWGALLGVGIVIIVVGAIVARSALGMLSLKTITPKRTTANLQKDVQLLKEHTS